MVIHKETNHNYNLDLRTVINYIFYYSFFINVCLSFILDMNLPSKARSGKFTSWCSYHFPDISISDCLRSFRSYINE